MQSKRLKLYIKVTINQKQMEQKKLKKEYFYRNQTRIQNLYVLDLFRNLLHPGFTPISPSGSFSTSQLVL